MAHVLERLGGLHAAEHANHIALYAREHLVGVLMAEASHSAHHIFKQQNVFNLSHIGHKHTL